MKILFFGDVFGKPGREAVLLAIKTLRQKEDPDFIIVNGENMAHGRGLQPEMALEFFNAGVDIITTGNHAWDQSTIIPMMEQDTRLLRPSNYPDSDSVQTPGRGVTVIKSRKSSTTTPLAVCQYMGRVFMDAIDCPFQKADQEINQLREGGVNCIFIDFHGEASSEKQAFANFMDGRASAVVGSHSHVQTADERILPGGTAAITDVGMCGCFDSVIGVKKETSIRKFLTKRPVKFEPATGPGGYGAVLVTLDEDSGRAKKILRLREEVAS